LQTVIGYAIQNSTKNEEMGEKEWVKTIIEDIELELRLTNDNIRVEAGRRLTYANEILEYNDNNQPENHESKGFETDVLVFEKVNENVWKPRVVIETKVGSVTTHDAITYSQKAFMHKNVHPYLRYGILISYRENYPLPGRLFRNGGYFDFMISWKDYYSDDHEREKFFQIINSEIEASKMLEEIIYNSRKKNREKFTVLHRPLKLQ
jgi:hypothetical protein